MAKAIGFLAVKIVIEVNDDTLAGKTFIDLFAGLGGFRYALESFGGRCVFSSEWDKHCQEVYHKNHGDRPEGDITKIAASSIPRHDILCAGFPCQPFSISGNMMGFKDPRGTMFDEICRIAQHHRTPTLLLENVGNLETHDNGDTFKVIKSKLNALGYDVQSGVLDSSLFGVPQHRERIYFVCTLDSQAPLLPSPPRKEIFLRDVLVCPEEAKPYEIDVKSFDGYELDDSYKSPSLQPIRIGKIQGGRQGERIYHANGHAITLSSGGGGIGAKTGMYLVGDVVRRLTPLECARLLGLPRRFIPASSDSQAYRQFGNSVVVDVIQYIIMQTDDIFS